MLSGTSMPRLDRKLVATLTHIGLPFSLLDARDNTVARCHRIGSAIKESHAGDISVIHVGENAGRRTIACIHDVLRHVGASMIRMLRGIQRTPVTELTQETACMRRDVTAQGERRGWNPSRLIGRPIAVDKSCSASRRAK